MYVILRNYSMSLFTLSWVFLYPSHIKRAKAHIVNKINLIDMVFPQISYKLL